MLSTNDISRIEGTTAYDTDGDKIGKVGQIYLDDETGNPSWVTVSTGLFGTTETFIPLDQASFDGNNLRLPYDKDKIKNAPRIDVDQHLEREQEDELYRYYGLSTGYSGTTGNTGTTGTGYTDTTTTTTTSGTTGTAGRQGDRMGDDTVQLHEERLRAGKETVESGRARLRKYVTSHTETVSVPVTKEQLVVERIPGDGTVTSGEIRSTGEEVEEVVLHEERAVVGKETIATEQVRLGTERVTEEQTVSAEVRKEEADVDVVEGGTTGRTGTTGTSGTTGTTGTSGTGTGLGR